VKFEFSSADMAVTGGEDIIAETFGSVTHSTGLSVVAAGVSSVKEVPETTGLSDSRPSSAKKFLDDFEKKQYFGNIFGLFIKFYNIPQI